MVRTFTLLTISLLLALSSYGQDIHFSQFYTQPLTLNPALAGDFVGDMRIAIIQRRQWGQLGIPLVTNGLSIQKKLRIYPDFLTFGLQLVNDKISTNNISTNKVHVSTTYLKKIGRNTFHIGVQLGYINRTIDFSGQSFPSQYNSATGNFDSSLPTGENGLGAGKGYLDFNIGVLWKTAIGKRYLFKLGSGMQHINKPNDTFSNSNGKLSVRYNLNHSSIFKINKEVSLRSAIQWLYIDGAMNMVTALNIRKVLSKYYAIYAGPAFRQNDAAILVIGFELGNLDMGFAYDINVSDFSQKTSNKTTVEFSLLFTAPPKKYKTHIPSKKKLLCPIPPIW